MELKFQEYDNLNSNETFDINQYNSLNNDNDKYWEKQKTEKPKKKKVNFNDILTNMNLVVNDKGVLQFMTPAQEEQNNTYYDNQSYSQEHQYYNNQQYNNQQQYNQQYNNQQQYQVSKNNEPLEPGVKHSYIYNKYFKDYRDANTPVIEKRTPKTIEELKKMLLEDKIKAIQQKNRIAQIKSTKLLFTNAGNINASKNNLRKMKF